MSQISKAIMAVQTPERKHITEKLPPLLQDVFDGKASIRKDFNVGLVYTIGIKLGSQCVITELELMKSKNNVPEDAINRTKRQIIEAIFGEFRPHIRRIEKAIYDYDYQEAGKLLYELEHVMFEPE